MSLYIFVYGSLMSPISAAHTLGYVPEIMVPAQLHGYKKTWGVGNAVQKYLTVEAAIDNDAWGILVLLHSEDDLEKLDKREALYSRADVSKQIICDKIKLNEGDIIYTYRAQAAPGKKALIYFDYYCLCYTAAHIYGHPFFNKWKEELPKLVFNK